MTATQNCPRCGAPITAESSPGGLCAACLMKMGLESRSGAPDLVFTGEHGKSRPAPPSIADLSPHFPELEILELVGQGGMGAVYKSKQRSLGRDVALKVLTVDTSADPSFAERFEREARTLAALSHPGITAVHDFGRRGQHWFFVMEFVDGANLRQMLRAREVGPREALSIVAQVCDALQYAHDHGVVHRDIKPENVLVTRKGQVKLLDFGLAKLVGEQTRDNATQAHSVMGTPHYMAPEQWEKPLTVDHRADIYALGVVFYELLTGELPIGRFAAPSHTKGVDARLDDVVHKTLEKEPERRYQQASEVKRDVEGVAVAGPIPPSKRWHAFRGKRWPWVIAGCGGCLMLFTVPALFFAFFVRSGVPNKVDPTSVSAPIDIAPHPDDLPPDDPILRDVRDEPRPKVAAVLNKAWRDYLALEHANSFATWLVEGKRLRVEVASFRTRRAEILDPLPLALGSIVDYRTATRIRDALAQRMAWGESDARFEIERFDENSLIQGWLVTPDIPAGTSELPREYQRQWDRFLPTERK